MTTSSAPKAPQAAHSNIASLFAEMAERYPLRAAVIALKNGAPRTVSFSELAADCDRIARGFLEIGLGRGTRAALMVRPGPEFFSVTFALFKIGAVPVFIDPGMGRRSLGQCLEEAAPEAFIAIPAAHFARAVLGWGRASVKTLVVVGPRLLPDMHSLDDVRRLGAAAVPLAPALSPFGGDGDARTLSHAAGEGRVRADDPAAILFTSGSTGAPKGAVYTHGNFIAQVGFLRDHFGIEPGEVDLPTFPLFGLFDAALGMTAVVPKMDFTKPGSADPENILGPIRRHEVTHLFGSPALLDRVGRHAEARGVRLPSLRRVVSAGAPVSPKIVERFAKLLVPGAEVHTPYGATEALPVASIASGEILGETGRLAAEGKGTCVGRPVEGVEVRILRVSDGPVAEWSDAVAAAPGEVGEIAVRGPNVTREYFRRPEADALAKLRDADGGLLHRMGDVGYLDDAGRLWFCGRKSQRVVTREGTLFTIRLEGIFNRHPKVRRTALVGVGAEPASRSASRSAPTASGAQPDIRPEKRPVLVVELEEGVEPSEEIKQELLELGAKHPETQAIRDVLFHPSLPVDIRHNAKIQREQLAEWAAERVCRRS